jgi:DNA-binding transcriptional LysR family regulator
MDSTRIEAFLETAENGSFSAAAERLGYSPSGVSRIIESLEAEFGFALFSRTRRGAVLTPEGERLLPRFQELRAANRLLDQTAADIRGVAVGELVVGTYFSIATCWLPKVLAEFSRRYPAISVTVIEAGNSELAELLASHRADCCFQARRDDGFGFVSLHRDEMRAWLPPQHPLAQQESVRLENLEGEPFIMPLPGTMNDVELLLAEAGVDVDVRYRSRDNMSVYAMVEAGLGLSLNNALMSERMSGSVVERPLDPPRMLDLGIALAADTAPSPAARRFVECACEVLGGSAGALGKD